MSQRLAPAALLAIAFSASLLSTGCGGSPEPAACRPVAETCNGLDDDCDGQIDQGLAGCCTPAATQSCGVAVGVCVVGTATCGADRAWGPCLDGGGVPVTLPGRLAEACNGADDDCDGVTDEQDAAGCTSWYADQDADGHGDPGTARCLCASPGGGAVTAADDCDDADPDRYPGAVERCDGKDNDCDPGTADGTGDASLGAACDGAADADLCADGVMACQSGAMVCVEGGAGKVELCNGVDDDCNGTVDDGLGGTPCCPTGNLADCTSTGAGTRCHAGAEVCVSGAFLCAGAVARSTEICNGVDDDCNGLVDDVPLLGVACAGGSVNTTGSCTAAYACNGGTPGPGPNGLTCTQVVGPTTEVCNGLDEDCDGTPDEAQSCYQGPPGTANVGACRAGTSTCVAGAYGACVGQVLPTQDLCDGIDNDCDSIADEDYKAGGSVSLTDYDGTSGLHLGDACGVGRCAGGAVVCDWDPTALTCTTWAYARPEFCNGVDDDCDGKVDDAPRRDVCALTLGVCSGKRTSTCAGASGWLPCTAADYGAGYEASETLCDGLDNDCDGAVDESLTGPLCPNQMGVCQGATRSCGGTAGWLPCSNADYEAHDPTYEAATETLCGDGLDNDCDGLADAADPDCPPWSHTIAIDGVNDFTAEERFATTTGGYSGWITWDADHLYVGYQGPEVAAASPTRWLLVYLGAVGPGTTTGVTYTTQSPHLPFPATHHARLKLDRSFFSLLAFNGSAWSPAAGGTMSYGLQGDFVELRFPLANLGSPPALAVHVSMINEAPGGEWTWGGIPATTFPSDGYDRDYAHYLEFDLAGTGAPASYPPR